MFVCGDQLWQIAQDGEPWWTGGEVPPPQHVHQLVEDQQQHHHHHQHIHYPTPGKHNNVIYAQIRSLRKTKWSSISNRCGLNVLCACIFSCFKDPSCGSQKSVSEMQLDLLMYHFK